MQELIDHLQKFQVGERQAMLDLESERNERRRLQQQVQTLREELTGLTVITFALDSCGILSI